ncbi:MAG: DMT family transporter [Tissierellia bacterium]|nr:DMT family transporter [Tissierellia bacterium]
MKLKKSTIADLALLIVAIIWGSGFIVTKNALDNIGPYYLLFFRFIVASTVLGTVMFKQIRNASKKDIKAGFIIGLFLFAGFATQTVGLQYTEAGKQAFITATNVVMVPFIYWGISKKRPDKFEVFAAFLCLTGIGILSLNRDFTMNIGDLLTLICAVLFACHISSTGYFAKESNPYVISVVQMATAAILSLIFALIFEGTNFSLETNTMIPILYLALFSTMAAFLIQTVAQKYTSSTHTAIILSLEAVFGSTLAIIFLKEAVTVKFFIGCLAILISVITAETKWEFLRIKEKTQ